MDFNLYQTLGQVSSQDAGQIFRDHLRGCVRYLLSEVMVEWQQRSTNFAGPNTNLRITITSEPAAVLAMFYLKARLRYPIRLQLPFGGRSPEAVL